MKKLILFSWIYLCSQAVSSQLSVPYFNNFDSSNSEVGWSHYAISGNDDWQLGIPGDDVIYAAYSAPNAWVTNLTGNYSSYSNQALETPFFDLTGQSETMVLSFFHQREIASSTTLSLEYQLGINGSWILLDNPTMGKLNWQTSAGFGNTISDIIFRSSIELSFLQNEDSVKFRFRQESNSSVDDGWMIDNFNIAEANFNIHAVQIGSVELSQNCTDFEVNIPLNFASDFSTQFPITTYCYLSNDDQYDESDILIGSEEGTSAGNNFNWSVVINLPEDLPTGSYHLLYQFDPLNTVEESDESDNFGSAVMFVKIGYDAPYVENFDEDGEGWTTIITEFSDTLWELGSGYHPHLEGAHSGTNAWHTSDVMNVEDNNFTYQLQYLESPTIDLTTDTGQLAINFWTKLYNSNIQIIQYNWNCTNTYSDVSNVSWAPQDVDDWDFRNIFLDGGSSTSFKVRFRYYDNTDYAASLGMSIDDFYVGRYLPDLSLEREKSSLFSSTASTIDTLFYTICNSGKVLDSSSTSLFYWSTDEILDETDLLLATKIEPSIAAQTFESRFVLFNKPTAEEGTYYILYILDATEEVQEMRENNNTGAFVVKLENAVNVPYYNDFEEQADHWYSWASLGDDIWNCSVPTGAILDTAISGIKSWNTGIVDPGVAKSRTHLYTPIFDFSNIENPILEFDMESLIHEMNMSYSVDGGAHWLLLDTTNLDFSRWYNRMERYQGITEEYDNGHYYAHNLNEVEERTFPNIYEYHGRDVSRNTHYGLGVPFLAGLPEVRFRFNLAVMESNYISPDFSEEGAIIDNFSISEKIFDLSVNESKAIMCSSQASSFGFFMNIKNQGNASNPLTDIKFYLSENDILDESDYLAGIVDIPQIFPDRSHHFHEVFSTPENFETYNYLLYDIDSDNSIIESNEANNIGSWPLALDSIQSYPYVNDFNSETIDGWYYTSIDEDGYLHDTRIRHRRAPVEFNDNFYKNGEWFTDDIKNSTRNEFKLYSPVFNFQSVDSIGLSFDLFCTGLSPIFSQDFNGTELRYNLGNVSWPILTNTDFEPSVWYNFGGIVGFPSNYTWSWSSLPETNEPILHNVNLNISHLGGNDEVTFRLDHLGTPHPYPNPIGGMRMDNFKIEAFPSDYKANDSLVDVFVGAQQTVNLEYSISNLGETNGRSTTTSFYWSTDSLWDSSDLLMQQIPTSPIMMSSDLISNIELDIPLPTTQNIYFILCFVDKGNDMNETNESNNLGSFRIHVDLIDHIEEIAISNEVQLTHKTSNTVSAMVPLQLGNQNVNFDWYSSNGQLISTNSKFIVPGENIILVPEYLSAGVYMVRATISKKDYMLKIVIP